MNIAQAADRALRIIKLGPITLGGIRGALYVKSAPLAGEWIELASGRTWDEVISKLESGGATEGNEMPTYVGKPGGKAFEPAPEGLHQAVCVDVIDRGTVKNAWGERPEVDLIFQVVPFDDETGAEMRDSEGNRFQLLARYRASLHEKANLYKHLVAWRGKAFTEAEIERFDLDTLLGANAQIQVAHNLGSNGRTYGNIQAIVPLGKKTTKLAPENYTRHKDRKQGNGAAVAHQDPDDDIPAF